MRDWVVVCCLLKVACFWNGRTLVRFVLRLNSKCADVIPVREEIGSDWVVLYSQEPTELERLILTTDRDKLKARASLTRSLTPVPRSTHGYASLAQSTK